MYNILELIVWFIQKKGYYAEKKKKLFKNKD